MEVSKRLIEQCKKMDKSSLIELFKMYEKYLYTICYNYCQNEQDALDIVQEVYIKVLKNIQSFDERYPFNPWIRKIAVNTCINSARGKNKTVISLNSELSDGGSVSDLIASEENIENDIVNKDINKIIMKSITALPENYRLIISLRYYEDLSYEEIARLLSKPLGTVKTEIYRAKAMLKKSLRDELEVV